MDHGLKERLFKKNKSGVPHGELWISGTVLKELGLEQTQESIIALSAGIGAELCFLSYTSPVQSISIESEEMKCNIKKAHDLGLVCGVAVDGPFQRTVKEHGFIETMRWFYQEEHLEKHFDIYTALAAAELAAAEEAGADLLILCDDIAYNKGLYFSPQQFTRKVLPLYQRLRNSVKKITMGFHSDGNVEPVLHSMLEQGYSVFSLEPEAMDLNVLCRTLSENTILLSGIKSEWLMGADNPVKRLRKEIISNIYELRSSCNLILASLCGLCDVNGLNNLKELYKLLESAGC